MRIIYTTCGNEVQVDDLHYPYLSQFNWQICGRGYVTSTINGESVKMHRLIVGLTLNDGKQCDHKDRNKLNNQLSNLRISTQSQNMANRSKYNGEHTSKFKGVHYCKRAGKWIAKIMIDKKPRYIGSFVHQENGALAYNKVAEEIFGEYAVLNEVEEGFNNPEPITYRGVYFHTRDNKWIANAKVGKDRYHLGSYDTEKEALEARNKWAEENGKPLQFWIGDSRNVVYKEKIVKAGAENRKRVRRKNSNS